MDGDIVDREGSGNLVDLIVRPRGNTVVNKGFLCPTQHESAACCQLDLGDDKHIHKLSGSFRLWLGSAGIGNGVDRFDPGAFFGTDGDDRDTDKGPLGPRFGNTGFENTGGKRGNGGLLVGANEIVGPIRVRYDQGRPADGVDVDRRSGRGRSVSIIGKGFAHLGIYRLYVADQKIG